MTILVFLYQLQYQFYP